MFEALLALVMTHILTQPVYAVYYPTDSPKPFVALETDNRYIPIEPTPIEEKPREYDKAAILDIIEKAATKYGVSEKEMIDTIACESKFQTNIQSYHIRPDGRREQSFGVAQFYLPAKNTTADGRVITKEIALNPHEAIDAMAYHFSIGGKSKWSCWNSLYGKI